MRVGGKPPHRAQRGPWANIMVMGAFNALRLRTFSCIAHIASVTEPRLRPPAASPPGARLPPLVRMPVVSVPCGCGRVPLGAAACSPPRWVCPLPAPPRCDGAASAGPVALARLTGLALASKCPLPSPAWRQRESAVRRQRPSGEGEGGCEGRVACRSFCSATQRAVASLLTATDALRTTDTYLHACTVVCMYDCEEREAGQQRRYVPLVPRHRVGGRQHAHRVQPLDLLLARRVELRHL